MAKNVVMRTPKKLTILLGGKAPRPLARGLAVMLTLALASVFSCAKKIEELEKWPFQAKGIKMTYRADPNLNVHDDEAHTLFVCMYQLIDPNAFNDLKASREGVIKLLECQRFDESVASSEPLVVHPGDEETIVFDRAEDARFFGVVAGYYNLWPGHVSKLVLVPVRIEKSGFFIRKHTAVPDKLEVRFYFGPEEIQQTLE